MIGRKNIADTVKIKELRQSAPHSFKFFEIDSSQVKVDKNIKFNECPFCHLDLIGNALNRYICKRCKVCMNCQAITDLDYCTVCGNGNKI